MFSGVVNAFSSDIGSNDIGKGKNQLTKQVDDFNKIARYYKKKGKGWVVIADENYGEGSSREHAAMEPRYLGCRAIIAKSMARIAETNLKRHGVLPLWFCHQGDYDLIAEDDLISIPDFSLAPDSLTSGQEIYLQVKHADGSMEAIPTRHTLSEQEIAWFKAGSALEWLRINTSSA